MGAASMAQVAQMNEPEPMPQPVADVTQIKEESSSEEEDDTMSYFAKLAKEG